MARVDFDVHGAHASRQDVVAMHVEDVVTLEADILEGDAAGFISGGHLVPTAHFDVIG